jgi:hypothetical protein
MTQLTALTALTVPTGDDMLYIVDDPSGVPLSRKVTVANLLATQMAYGAFYGTIAQSQASAAQNTWYAVNDTDITDVNLLNITGDGAGKLTVASAGIYKIDYSITLESNGASKHLEAGIMVGGVINAAGQTHMEGTINLEMQMGGTTILSLAATNYIQMAFRTTDTGTPTIIADQVSLSIVKIGV